MIKYIENYEKVISKLITLTSYNKLEWDKLEKSTDNYKNYIYVDTNFSNQYHTNYSITNNKYITFVITQTKYNIFMNVYYKNNEIGGIYYQTTKTIFDLFIVIKYHHIKNNNGLVDFIKSNINDNKLKWDYIPNSNEPFYIADFLLTPDKSKSSIIMVFYDKIKIVNGVTIIDTIEDNSLFDLISKHK